MTIAVTGAKGRLGSELLERGCVPLECDISSRDGAGSAAHDYQLRLVHCRR